MKFYHFSPVQNLGELVPSQPRDSDLFGVYLTNSLDDSWYWLKRMIEEEYFKTGDIYVYEVELDPCAVFHPRYEGDKIKWINWDGLLDKQTFYKGSVPCFNNYQQFVYPHKLQCKRIL